MFDIIISLVNILEFQQNHDVIVILNTKHSNISKIQTLKEFRND